MDTDAWITEIAWAAAGVLFLAAAFLYLLQETRCVPQSRRAKAMATLPSHLLCRWLPSRHSIIVSAAGFGAFVGFGSHSMAICWGLLIWYGSTQPEEMTPAAGAGQAGILMMCAVIGFGFSMLVGMQCGFSVVGCVDKRLSRHR